MCFLAGPSSPTVLLVIVMSLLASLVLFSTAYVFIRRAQKQSAISQYSKIHLNMIMWFINILLTELQKLTESLIPDFCAVWYLY